MPTLWDKDGNGEQLYPEQLAILLSPDVITPYTMDVEITEHMTEEEYKSEVKKKHHEIIDTINKKVEDKISAEYTILANGYSQVQDTLRSKRPVLHRIYQLAQGSSSIINLFYRKMSETIQTTPWITKWIPGSFPKWIVNIPKWIADIPRILQEDVQKPRTLTMFISSHSSFPQRIDPRSQDEIFTQVEHAVLYTAGAGYRYGEMTTFIENVINKYLGIIYIFKYFGYDKGMSLHDRLMVAYKYVNTVFPNEFVTRDSQVPDNWSSDASIEYESLETIFEYDFDKADYFSYTGTFSIIMADFLTQLGIEEVDMYGPYTIGDSTGSTRPTLNMFDLTIVENYAYFVQRMAIKGIDLPERLSDTIIISPHTGPRYNMIRLSTLFRITYEFGSRLILIVRACRGFERVCDETEVGKIEKFVKKAKIPPSVFGRVPFETGGKSRHRRHKSKNQTRRRKHTKKRHRRRKNNIKFSRYSK